MDPKSNPLVGQADLLDGEETSHRFSLPINFLKGGKPDSGKNILNKNKVYASNGMDKLRNFANDGPIKPVELNLIQVTRPKAEEEEEEAQPLIAYQFTHTVKHSHACRDKSIVQSKSWSSSNSTQQTSFEFDGSKLIAYYSMPELRILNMGSVVKMKSLLKTNKHSRSSLAANEFHFSEATLHYESMVNSLDKCGEGNCLIF